MDDLSVLGVLDDSAVTGELFFQRLHDPLLVKLFRDSLEVGKRPSEILPSTQDYSNVFTPPLHHSTHLNRGESLTPVPLLDSDVNESVAVHTPAHIVFVNIERVEVCKVLMTWTNVVK